MHAFQVSSKNILVKRRQVVKSEVRQSMVRAEFITTPSLLRRAYRTFPTRLRTIEVIGCDFYAKPPAFRSRNSMFTS